MTCLLHPEETESLAGSEWDADVAWEAITRIVEVTLAARAGDRFCPARWLRAA
jgi:hypothetical protein